MPDPNDLFTTYLKNGGPALQILLSKKFGTEFQNSNADIEADPKPTSGIMYSRRKPDEIIPKRSPAPTDYTWLDIDTETIGLGYTYSGSSTAGRTHFAIKSMAENGTIFAESPQTINSTSPYVSSAGELRLLGGLASGIWGCISDGQRAAGWNSPYSRIDFTTGLTDPNKSSRRAVLFNTENPPGQILANILVAQVPGGSGWLGPGNTDMAFDVNDDGLIVGATTSTTAAVADLKLFAIKWSHYSVATILFNNTVNSIAVGVNILGEIIGQYGGVLWGSFATFNGSSNEWRSFDSTPYLIHSNGSVEYLSSKTGTDVAGIHTVKAIADNGDIIGYHDPAGEGVPSKSFFWDRTTDTVYNIEPDLEMGVIYEGNLFYPADPEDPESEDENVPVYFYGVKAEGLNNNKQVVGSYVVDFVQMTYFSVEIRRGFIWDPVNGMKDLQDLVPASDTTDIRIYEGIDINDRGDLAVMGADWNIVVDPPVVPPGTSFPHGGLEFFLEAHSRNGSYRFRRGYHGRKV